LRHISRLSTVTVAFDVKRRSLTLFPVLPKPEVVFNGQTVADRSIYCIKVEKEVGYREFVYAVSAIFLLPVWPEMAVGLVGGLFSPVMLILRCIIASRLAQSATGRQPTTRILIPVQLEVNIRRPMSPVVLFCRPEAFGLFIC